MSHSQRRRRLACNFSRQIFPISSGSTETDDADNNGLQSSKSKLPDCDVPPNNSSNASKCNPVTVKDTIDENHACLSSIGSVDVEFGVDGGVRVKETVTKNFACLRSTVRDVDAVVDFKVQETIAEKFVSSKVGCVDVNVDGQRRDSRMDQTGACASDNNQGWATWRTNNVPSFETKDMLDDRVEPLQPPGLPMETFSERNHIVSSQDTRDRRVKTFIEHAAADSVSNDILPLFQRSPNSSSDLSVSKRVSPKRTEILTTSSNYLGGTVQNMMPPTDPGSKEMDVMMNQQTTENTSTYGLFGSGDIFKDITSAMVCKTSSQDLMSSSSTDSFFGSNGTTKEIPPEYQEEVKQVLADSKDVFKHLRKSGTGSQATPYQHLNRDCAAVDVSSVNLEEQMNRLCLQGSPLEKDQRHVQTKLVDPLHDHSNATKISTQPDTIRKNSSSSSIARSSFLKSDVRGAIDILSSAASSAPPDNKPFHPRNQPGNGEVGSGTSGACADTKSDLSASLRSTTKAVECNAAARSDLNEIGELGDLTAMTDITQDGIPENLISFTSLPPLEDFRKLDSLLLPDSSAPDLSESVNTSQAEGSLPFKQCLSPCSELPRMPGRINPAISPEDELEFPPFPCFLNDLTDDEDDSGEFLSARQSFSPSKKYSSSRKKSAISSADEHDIPLGPSSVYDLLDDKSAEFLSARQILSPSKSHSSSRKKGQDISLGPSSVHDLPDDDSAQFLSARPRFSGRQNPGIPMEEKQICSLIGSLTQRGGVVTEMKESSLVVCQGDDKVMEQNCRELAQFALNKADVRTFKGRGNDMAIAVSNSRDVQVVDTFQYNKQILKVSVNEVTKNIKSQVKRELSESKKIFAKTSAYEAVSSVLETEQIVFIIGPSSVGKRMIALELLREYGQNGFEPLIFRNVDEMRQRLNTESKQIVLMRNIFGTFEFEQKRFDDWIEYFETIEVCADEMKKFIFTSKDHIFERGTPWLSMRNTFKEEHVVNLQKLDILNPMEKRMILCRHLQELDEDLDDSLIEKIVECSTPRVFPKCCQIFASRPDLHNLSCAINFFQRPVSYYRNIFAVMFQRDDKKQFAVLLLTMIFGQLHDSLLQDLNSPDAEKAQKYLSVLGYGDSMLRLTLRPVAESMLETFLKRSQDAFVFADECLYDAVACVFGSKYPRYLLEVCSVDFLCEQVHVDQTANIGDVSLLLQEGQVDFLAQRLVQELRNGNTNYVSLHVAFAHPPFIKCFVKYCEKQDDFCQIIQSKDKLHSYTYLYWSSWNQREHLFKWLFSECKKQKVPISSKEMMTIIKACCVSGNVDVLKIVFRVVKKVPEMVKNCETTSVPLPSCRSVFSLITTTATGTVLVSGLLHTACFRGYLSIVDLLVHQFKSPVDRPDTYGQYPVNIAARQGHVDVVKFLIQNGVKINHVKPEKHVIHDACETGQTEVVKILLEECPKLLDIVDQSSLRYPIHFATMSKEAKLVKLLLQKGAKPDVLDSHENTAFHTACMKTGNLKTLKALNPSSDQVKMVNKRKKTCLHLACEFGGPPMVSFLSSMGADVNAVDFKGQTSLHVACRGNKRKIVEKLLACKEVDLFVLDIQGKSALHLTTSKNIQKLLKDNMGNGNDVED